LVQVEPLNLITDGYYSAHDLMTRTYERSTYLQLPFNDMKIGAANATRGDAHQYFIAFRNRHRAVGKFKWMAVDGTRRA
jgi:hypothetical protein